MFIIQQFLITNVHSGGEGTRNRKWKSSESAKDSNIYSSNKEVTYPSGYPGAPGIPSVPAYPYPDPSYWDEPDDGGEFP